MLFSQKFPGSAAVLFRPATRRDFAPPFTFDIEKGKYWVTAQISDGKVMLILDGLNLKGRLPEGAQFSGIEFQDMRTDSKDVVTIEFSPQGWIEPVTVYIASSKGGKMSVVINEMLGSVETFELLE